MRRIFPAITILLAIAATPGAADHALVLSTAYNAAREPASVHAQLLDLDSGAALPGALRLPGREITGVLDRIEAAGVLYVSTESGGQGGAQAAATGASWLSILGVAPLHSAGRARIAGDFARLRIAGLLAGDDGAPILVLAGSPRTAPGSGISFQDWRGGAPVETRRWGIVGELMDAVVLADGRQVAAAYRTNRPGLAGIIRGTYGAAPEARAGLPTPEGCAATLQPLKLAQHEDALLALGICAAREPRDAPGMWLQLLDASTLQPRGPALALPGGQLGARDALLPDGQGGFWIGTRSPDTRFAYVTRVSLDGGAIEKTAAYSLPKTSTPLYMAPAPGGAWFAVAYNQTVEIWPAGRREQMVRHELGGPVQALAWTADGRLLAGETGRIHLLREPFHAISANIQLQSGWVNRIFPLRLDAESARAVELDTDGDGIPDALDPEPLAPSPTLRAPDEIIFRGEAAGREVRAFRVTPEYYEEAPWRILPPVPEEAPWLHVAPIKGFGPGAVYMGVDPSLHDPGAASEARIEARMGGVAAPEAHGSPAWISVGVLPRIKTARQILWVWDTQEVVSFRDPASGRQLRVLADALAAPPYYFAHRELAGNVPADLSPYAVVVAPVRALAQGRFVRRELLDYVLDGGGVLILGDVPEAPYPFTLEEWFRPAGVEMRFSDPVNGEYIALPRRGISTGGARIRMENGSRFLTRHADIAPIPGAEKQSVMAAVDYGYGRMIFLASTTPLLDTAMREEAAARLALSCFTWLAEAGNAIEDMDGDLLVDAVEDADNNGAVDRGETDFLNADTDSDGVSDGMEDLNRNGKTDPGETDPRNPDTDGDGVPDGADATPYPHAGPQLPGLQGIVQQGS